MPVLVVNVDHVATLRQARMGSEPEPITAAHLAEMGGAQGIIVHLREDRRHIQDRDLSLLKATLTANLHLEMAATDEMHRIALEVQPHMICLVPEKREELTTEGGLQCMGREDFLRSYLAPFKARNIYTSLFIDAEPEQIQAAASAGADYIEIHTGHYADARDHPARQAELEKIISGIKQAGSLGLRVNLGHGLNYQNILAFSGVKSICEFSIGHSIISRAVMVGIKEAVAQMNEIIRSFSP
ncbi:pyridoxine 5'-phosphate synthase [Desulfonatronospira sp.]|uniref:pyridoxine 5'-phosphate synthase n=1 Tax=Desulfonatronospira sp. TaxID=1962951 RepID=UPI0025BE5E8C|nr:pyridoxine 5'-phosphate synthase [Desulfonatronospira sp.]